MENIELLEELNSKKDLLKCYNKYILIKKILLKHNLLYLLDLFKEKFLEKNLENKINSIKKKKIFLISLLKAKKCINSYRE